jgi:DNA mismatch endonuclease (patch repair protein)
MNTGPEMLLRRELWRRGVRYRLGAKLLGRPDMVFMTSKVAVFVDGCFWHGCPEHSTKPKTNESFWTEKLRKNRSRDDHVSRTLAESGWHVMRIWEHEIKTELLRCADAVEAKVRELNPAAPPSP